MMDIEDLLPGALIVLVAVAIAMIAIDLSNEATEKDVRFECETYGMTTVADKTFRCEEMDK